MNYSYNKPALKEEKMGWSPWENRGYGYAIDFALSGRMLNQMDADTDDLNTNHAHRMGFCSKA